MCLTLPCLCCCIEPLRKISRLHSEIDGELPEKRKLPKPPVLLQPLNTWFPRSKFLINFASHDPKFCAQVVFDSTNNSASTQYGKTMIEAKNRRGYMVLGYYSSLSRALFKVISRQRRLTSKMYRTQVLSIVKWNMCTKFHIMPRKN